MKDRVARADQEKSSQSLSEPRKDFFYWLTNASDPVTGEGYSMPEMWAESRLLIAAGSDTSSITTAATFFYLLRNPKVLAKLQHELRTTFDSVDEIRSGTKLNNCVYLRAVIEETLRVAPPVPSSLPREVMAGGMDVDGYHLPEGTIVGTSAYAIHRNVDHFDNPTSYRPERWIVDEDAGVTAEDVARAKAAFCPFSLGSRGCVGKPMAYAELSVTLGRVFYRFDVRLLEGDRTGEGEDGMFRLRDLFVSGRDGPFVEFKKAKA
jgi:cytochrome P450